MAQDEDWIELLEQYLPPANYSGDRAQEARTGFEAPWQAALHEAARAARAGSGPVPPARQDTARRARRQAGGPPEAGGGQVKRSPAPEVRRTAVLKVGDRVKIRSLAGSHGVILALSGETATVGTDTARIKVQRTDLVVLPPDHAAPARPNGSFVLQPGDGFADRTTEVHRRGQRASRLHALDLHGLLLSEALDQLDDFLVAAWEDGRATVAVIHGKGAGTLRAAVRSALAAHPAVRHAEPAATRSGGDGVTIVTLYAYPHPRNDGA